LIAALTLAADPVIPQSIKAGSNTCARTNGTFCWDWFSAHWSSIFGPALVQHLLLTVIALVVGFVLSLALALLAHRVRWLNSPIALVAGFLFTIPSLALFQLLVPITGLNRLTAEVALVSYTIYILFRNMVVGLNDVPAEVREAAEGMGLTRRQVLWKVELPLAVPAIIAGVRVASVTVISLATIAATIIDDGLGQPIFDAIQRGVFKTEFLAAAVLAIALAFIADGLFVLLQRVLTPWASARRS
jgi:osmoprotectant transport system permease protein